MLTAVALAVVGWAVVAKLSGGDQPPPAAVPPAVLPSYGSPGSPSDPLPTAPPPWGTDPRGSQIFLTIYRSTPLDGHWVSPPLSLAQSRRMAGTRPHERVTLQFRSTALAVWAGPGAVPDRRLLSYEAVYVQPHRVQLSPVGVDGKAVYRWRVQDRMLRFRLLRATTGASPSSRLVTVSFRRGG